jgi:mannitol/fructose-specific phosphotransferase system IIA component
MGFGSWGLVLESELVNLVERGNFAVAVLGNFVAVDPHLVDLVEPISSSVVAVPTVSAIAVVLGIDA